MLGNWSGTTTLSWRTVAPHVRGDQLSAGLLARYAIYDELKRALKEAHFLFVDRLGFEIRKRLNHQAVFDRRWPEGRASGRALQEPRWRARRAAQESCHGRVRASSLMLISD
jgi:hypothetical protein